MNKVVECGHTAVILSPGYGAGWSTWNPNEYEDILLFHPLLIEAIRHEQSITHELLVECGIPLLQDGSNETEIYLNDPDLQVFWIPNGTKFRVIEYDGHESIISEADLNHTV